MRGGAFVVYLRFRQEPICSRWRLVRLNFERVKGRREKKKRKERGERGDTPREADNAVSSFATGKESAVLMGSERRGEGRGGGVRRTRESGRKRRRDMRRC